MADTPRIQDNGDDAPHEAPQAGRTTSTPRWVKVFGIIALAVVLLFTVLLLTGRGSGHGPSRHAPSGGANGGAASSLGAPAESHTKP